MDSNSQYARREYWDARFKEETSFEWLASFDAFKSLLLTHLNTEMKLIFPNFGILHIGCGSSDLSMRLYELGFTNITNVDYSEVLINSMRSLHPEMSWCVDDIRSLSTLDDEYFDVVIEKATLEALLVNEKSPWSPSNEALNMLNAVFTAIQRVLKPKGLFVSISFTQPHFRVPALLRSPWKVEFEEFGDSFHYFMYTCRKGEETSENLKNRYSKIAPDWLRVVY